MAKRKSLRDKLKPKRKIKFKSMVAGKERLVGTYWVWGVLGTFLISVNLALWGPLVGLSTILIYSLVLIYWVPVAIGIWRSASAYKGNQIWAILAKAAVVLGLLRGGYLFYIELY